MLIEDPNQSFCEVSYGYWRQAILVESKEVGLQLAMEGFSSRVPVRIPEDSPQWSLLERPTVGSDSTWGCHSPWETDDQGHLHIILVLWSIY